MQDFHSFRQALNVASADQRVLVLVAGKEKALAPLRDSLKPVANHPEAVGRYHLDFDTTGTWKEPLSAPSGRDSGIFVIHPGEFGLKGTIVRHLPLQASPETVFAAMDQARIDYAKETDKKVYSDHVTKGRRLGIYFEGAVPYGEDRDGDGVIDHRAGDGARGGKGKGKGKGPRS